MPTITRSRRSKRSNGVAYAYASMGVPSHYSPACVSCYHNVSNARRSRQDVGLECLRQPLRALRGGPFCCPGHLISLCATYHSSQRPRPTAVKTGVGSANRRQHVGLQVVVAERVGFEPTVRLPVQRFSRPSHSTSLAPLRIRKSKDLGALATGTKRKLPPHLPPDGLEHLLATKDGVNDVCSGGVGAFD